MSGKQQKQETTKTKPSVQPTHTAAKSPKLQQQVAATAAAAALADVAKRDRRSSPRKLGAKKPEYAESSDSEGDGNPISSNLRSSKRNKTKLSKAAAAAAANAAALAKSPYAATSKRQKGVNTLLKKEQAKKNARQIKEASQTAPKNK